MNATMQKFGYPQTLVAEYSHWVVLLRPSQVTLGSLIMAARSNATAFADLPPEAFAEQAEVVAAIERRLRDFSGYQRINYLMLMMVDPHVHFHVLPRYDGVRNWEGLDFVDTGWPGQPRLDRATQLSEDDIRKMTTELSLNFR